ncbi:hypothetical protein [[Mycoplasma] imitans]|uniref:hypothetical protein n=1 Tax=[Mycoplasma] imitans TaxID=29560 RepID=UPI000564FE58|nr:hypothetical protein [[Mycoplasma] imitans]
MASTKNFSSFLGTTSNRKQNLNEESYKNKWWLFYKTKKEIDMMNENEIKENLETSLNEIKRRFKVDEKADDNVDFVITKSIYQYPSNSRVIQYDSTKLYFPILSDVIDENNEHTLSNFERAVKDKKLDEESILFYYENIRQYLHETDKFLSLITHHYLMLKLWQFQFLEERIRLNNLTKKIDINTLQNNVIKFGVGYFNFFKKTPYFKLKTELHLLTKKLILHSSLVNQNNDVVLDWIKGIEEYLIQHKDRWYDEKDRSQKNRFKLRELIWQLNELNHLNEEYKRIVDLINDSVSIRWVDNIKKWRVFWKQNRFPIDRNGNVLPNKNRDWFAE